MTTATIPRIADPNEERFSELMQQSYKKVYNMAYRLAGNRPDAEDLTQEAFYRAYRSFSDYEGDKPFENWIFRIVTRLFLDLLRHRRRRVKAMSFDAPIAREGGDDAVYFDVPDQAPTAEERLLEHTFSEDMEKTLNALSPEQRLLVTLADIEQVPYKEIADLMDKPVGTIRSRLHRAHKLMREILERRRTGSPKGLCPTA